MLCAVALLHAGCTTHLPKNVTPGTHVVLYSNLSPEKAVALQQEADRTVEDIAEFLRLDAPPARARVILFRSAWSRWRYLARECPEQSDAAAACFETPNGYTVALSERLSMSKTLRYLRHELSHYVVAAHFHDVPPWIDEGLAQFFEPGPPYGQPHPARLKSLARQVRRKRQGTLRRLIAVPPGTRLTLKQYAQAWGLAYLLVTEADKGPVLVKHYLEQVSADEDPQEQFGNCFGQFPDEMEPAWREYILHLAECQPDS